MVMLPTNDSRHMTELLSLAPQWYLQAPAAQAPMHLYQNPSLRGTLVKSETGSSLGSPESAVTRTTAKPMWALRQSGDRADLFAQKLDMVSTSITTPLTELHTLDDKMIDWSQMEASVFPNGFESLVEDSIHENPPTSTLNAAIFDVQLDLSMGLGEELQQPSPTGTLTTLPSMTGMVNSVLPSERPISPSEFLHQPTSSSQHQSSDFHLTPEVNEMIEQLLPHIPPDVNWDSSQLDLNLFNHPEEPDALGCLVQEFGIHEETEEESSYCKEEIKFDNFPTAMALEAVTSPQPSRPQRESVGPLRVRRERRSKRPARFRDAVCLDEDVGTPVTTTVSERVKPEVAVASTSDPNPTRTRGNCSKELSNEEKYFRSRQQNNLASKRCREKRKANLEKMTDELKTLEEKNQILNDKVVKLTALRDEFQKFVNNFLFQRMMQK